MSKFIAQFNIFGSCRRLNVGLWSCPRFIFLVMGVVIMASILATYTIAERYAEPDIVIGTVTALTIFLLIVTQVLVNAFERVVDLRTSEMKQSKELLELKDQLVYIAVHDLSTSATAVKWGLRSLEPSFSKLKPEEKEIFSNIRMKNERLIELVRQILLIGRIESGRLNCQPKKIDLNERTRAIIDHTERGAIERGVKITSSLSTSPLFVEADAEHLNDVLRILVTNAIRHADREHGEVTVTLRDTGSQAALTVENNGAGIDETKREHLFQKFWRDRAGTKIEGTGFGLYTAKKLAEAMKGNIGFSSEPGKTAFTLQLIKIP